MDLTIAPSPLVDRSEPATSRLGDRYVTVLGFVLLGYSLLGKGFAYWGFAPVFVGEMTLLAGLIVVLAGGRKLPILFTATGLLLLAFMGWGAFCTFPYVARYQIDALRDGAVWGYATYAFIVSSLIAQNPQRLVQLIGMFRKYIGFFLWLAPIAYLLTRNFEPEMPHLNGGEVAIVQVKGGDLLVQLTGVFAFIAVIGCDLPAWQPLLLVPLLFGINIQGRAGIVTLLVGMIIVTVVKPFSRFVIRLWIILALLLFLLWATDLHIKHAADSARDLSFDQLVSGTTSIFGDSKRDALDGSKEWRLRWWQTIEDYTFHGKYFWTGKGFGINLAEDDGFTVDEDNSLRNPHNAHMTMLARAGVPGLCIWIATQLAFAVALVRGYLNARHRAERRWANLFLFLFVFWAAFIANATFDVFLEGPMGGIWFWSVYGTGMGAAYVFRHAPEVLDRTPAMEEDERIELAG